MARVLYALSPKALADDAALLAECARQVDIGDWWICAELAGS